MNTDKPLHVQVAEALGCQVDDHERCQCPGLPHGTAEGRVRPYDADIAAVWPEAERLGLSVIRLQGGTYLAGDFGGGWWPNSDALDGYLAHHAEAETAPRALSLAILNAKLK